MSTALLYPPEINGLQKTLGAQLDQGTTAALTLNNTTNVQNKPGVIVVDRIDTSGNEKDAADREFVLYTAVSGSTLTGLTRNADGGSSDQDHALGAIVEFVPDVLWGQAVIDALANLVNTTTLAVDTTKVVTLTATQTLTNKTLTSPAMTSPSVTSGDVNLATGLNIQVNGADPKRGFYIPATAMYPSTTAGCAGIAQIESSTNDVNIKALAFDGAGTSKEYAEFGIPSPSYWDASTITATFYWYAAAGSGTVNWELQGLALADDDALDTAYGTLQEVTDTLTAIGDVHVSAETSAVTIAGTPTAGDWVMFKVARDPANDTNTSDANLIGVRIRFGIAKYDDQ